MASVELRALRDAAMHMTKPVEPAELLLVLADLSQQVVRKPGA